MSEPAVENFIDASNNKKVNKRRSSVFKRQSIAPTDQDLETTNVSEEINQESKRFKFQNENESKLFDIKKYIESLKDEDKKWREEYAKRKSRTQELSKRQKSQEQMGQKLDITCLSDSDRAFLVAKPNYEEFNKNVFQLHAMTVKVTYFNIYAEHIYKELRTKLQNDTDEAVHRIINLLD